MELRREIHLKYNIQINYFLRTEKWNSYFFKSKNIILIRLETSKKNITVSSLFQDLLPKDDINNTYDNIALETSPSHNLGTILGATIGSVFFCLSFG